MDQAIDLAFVPTSEGIYLDLAAVQFGISRQSAVKATGEVSFVSSAATTVPAGTQVSTTAAPGGTPIVFETGAAVVIASATTTAIAITAVIAGTAGNVAATTINRLVGTVNNISSVSNVAVTAIGADEETDEELRSRTLTIVRQPSHGGNIGDYLRWGKEASPDIGKVGVYPLHAGNGTVQVLILTRSGSIPSAALIQTVQDYIDPVAPATTGKSPIGATVTVAAPSAIVITVDVTLSVLPGFTNSEVIAAADTAIDAYVDSLAIGADVTFHGMATAIMAVPGVNTISVYSVNAGTADIVIAANQYSTNGAHTVD
jgi:uncharacterized phage protein gp47/JayE